MPETSGGDPVYADPAAVEGRVQTDPDVFSLSTTTDSDGDGASEWVEFLETLQVEAKARIDSFCGRDFENHPSATVMRDGGASASRFVDLPTPVQSITEVTVDGEVVPAAEYRLLKDRGQLLRLDEDGDPDTWATGYGNIAIDLDWGYSTPPEDVAAAETKLVVNGVGALAQMREGLVVQQDDIDLQVSLPSEMTAEVRAMLRPHRDSGRGGATIL